MKACHQQLEVFYRSLSRSAQWFFNVLAVAALFISGGLIGSSIGKAIYFLTN